MVQPFVSLANSSSAPSLPDPSDYVSQLRTHMQRIRPPPPRLSQRNSHVSEALATATHVFIRRDAVRKPLQPPYDGPYSVLKRTDKHFTVDINGRKDTVSVDRLKPAHLDNDIPYPTPSLNLRQSHHIALLALDDEFISQGTSHHTCRKPLGGGEWCSELNHSLSHCITSSNDIIALH